MVIGQGAGRHKASKRSPIPPHYLWVLATPSSTAAAAAQFAMAISRVREARQARSARGTDQARRRFIKAPDRPKHLQITFVNIVTKLDYAFVIDPGGLVEQEHRN